MSRVLHIISGMEFATTGPNVALRDILRSQQAAGIDVSVAGTYRGPDNPAELWQRILPAEKVSAIGPCVTNRQSHPDLSSTLIRRIAEADLIHLHGLWEKVHQLACQHAQRRGLPWVITPHGMLTRWSIHQHRLKKEAYLKLVMGQAIHGSAALHFTTEVEMRSSMRFVRQNRYCVIPLGVDIQNITSTLRGDYLAQRLGSKQPTIVFLGRLHPGKGMEYLVPAMRHVKPKDARLVAIGPDADGYQAHLQQQAQEAGVAERVVFLGPIRPPELYQALASADVFCLPSDHENFGLAAVEAMACGTATVLSKHVAIGEPCVEAGGALFAEQDPPQLARSLSSLLQNPAAAQALAERGKQVVSELFDVNRVAQQWISTYEEIRCRKSGRPTPKVSLCR